jgi:hypothetical protein
LGAEGFPSAFFGADVLEERSSSRCFLFLSRLGSSKIAGGGDVVELLSSRETSASSSSWPPSASGASEVTNRISLNRSFLRKRRTGNKNWCPCTRVNRKTVRKAETKYKKANKRKVDE